MFSIKVFVYFLLALAYLVVVLRVLEDQVTSHGNDYRNYLFYHFMVHVLSLSFLFYLCQDRLYNCLKKVALNYQPQSF
jgi:hypothetical protein